MCDQWRIGPWGVVLGLDWTAIEVLLKALEMPFNATLIEGLRVMEGEVLRAWSERRAPHRP